VDGGRWAEGRGLYFCCQEFQAISIFGLNNQNVNPIFSRPIFKYLFKTIMDAKQNFAAHFAKLRTYTLSRELSDDIFLLTKRFPIEERYSLTDQIRRSSRSIGAQIAEAWGKRRYQRHK
jgi:hypothetical protein